MHSRLVRLLIVIIGVAIVAASAFFLNNLEKQRVSQQTMADVVREQARALNATIADVHAGQFGYVARGQGEAFWMTQVENLLPTLNKQAVDFGTSLTAPSARTAYEPVSAALENFQTLDTRVRDFVKGGNELLAADLIFADGVEATTTAATQVTLALDQEIQSRMAAIAALRSRELAIFGTAFGGVVLLMLALALSGAAQPVPVATGEAPVVAPVEPVKFETPLPKARPALTPKLVCTAQLCSELSRVVESEQLPDLLRRAARVLDASGIIVWIADAAGRELRPAMSHGYPAQTVTRMGSIARDANNAAAAAYRSAEIRTVTGENGSSGALILPLTTGEGCIGVLSTEMKGGAEKDEGSQALASIFAAQLATLVATPAAPAMKVVAQA